jgi:hypothetical protein
MRGVAAALVIACAAAGCGPRPAERDTAPPLRQAPPARPALAAAPIAGTPLVVEVAAVERKSAGVLEVRFTLANRSAAPFDVGASLAARPDETRSVSGVSVFSPDGASRVLVLRDERGVPQCSRDVAPLGPDERRDLVVRTLPPGGAATSVLVDVPGAGRLGPVVISPAPAPR